jgi:hypothetical protein
MNGFTIEELFPYEYAGGGYFRKKGVPVGQKAEILHGQQAIEFLHEAMLAAIVNNLSSGHHRFMVEAKIPPEAIKK